VEAPTERLVPFATAVLPEPTADEKTLAVLAHALQLVSAFIAPLIILLVKRESKFVRFHALQVLFLHIAYVVVFGGLLALCAIGILVFSPALDSKEPPVGLLVLFPLVWLGLMGAYVLTLVLAVVYAFKAGRGEWAAYPIVGRFAAKVAGVTLP
jgi:uncharacterized membrane protein